MNNSKSTFYSRLSIWLWIFVFLSSFLSFAYAQESGRFSGGFESNTNFFIRDSLIGAANIPQYDRQLVGSEAWLNLNYSYQGFDVGLRFDLFNNSNLRIPTGSFTGQGIGMWFIRKSIGKLDLQAGYIYDQIGSGIIFRAYEQRPLLIDNALIGAKAAYHLNDNWVVKGFTGKQRFLFEDHDGIIRGLSIDGYVTLGNPESPITLAPGIGVVNRTLSDESAQDLVDIIRFYRPEDIVTPTYNTYAFSAFNTLTYKWLTWYFEAAYKTPEVFNDPMEPRTTITGGNVTGRYVRESGSVIYNSISAAIGNLGLTLEGKRTEHFNFRADPNLTQLDGLINYIPPMNRQNSYRMTARYAPAVQDLSEIAFQADATYSFSRKFSLHANTSYINTIEGEDLYREIYIDGTYKHKRLWQLTLGVQRQVYNQEVYEIKPEVPNVETITPFADFLYRFSRTKSLRFETQYMHTDEDFGKWWFGLLEYGMAPHWIFEASIMYNLDPNEDRIDAIFDENNNLPALVYPTLGVVYVHNANRYSLRYVKQVQGIVCTGGICRLEPAFSGFKFQVASTF